MPDSSSRHIDIEGDMIGSAQDGNIHFTERWRPPKPLQMTTPAPMRLVAWSNTNPTMEIYNSGKNYVVC